MSNVPGNAFRLDNRNQLLYIIGIFFLLYATAIVFRPLLPVDETRYLGIAWEMNLRHDWLAPLTMNFEPYFQKPPLLFWLINASWLVFGVSRWAATIPVVLSSIACLYLTAALAGKLVPELRRRVPLVMIGSVPFLIYCTLILFDLTLTVFVLATLLCMVSHAKERRWFYPVLMGLFLGLGALTKGPVVYLDVIFPMLAGPLWIDGDRNWKNWYGGCLIAILLSAIPILIWLVPVLGASSESFAVSLLWDQTAGRMTGSGDNAHARPFYFYLPLLPVLFLPWAFLPGFWKGLRPFRNAIRNHGGLLFLILWTVPTFITFSLISGKQPHYLVPILPGVIILTAFVLREVPTRDMWQTAAITVALAVVAQIAGSTYLSRRYDLQPIAGYVGAHPGIGLAYIGDYQGEITFLGRLTGSIDSLRMDELKGWFSTHPGGLAIIRFRDRGSNPFDLKLLVSTPYHGNVLGVFSE